MNYTLESGLKKAEESLVENRNDAHDFEKQLSDVRKNDIAISSKQMQTYNYILHGATKAISLQLCTKKKRISTLEKSVSLRSVCYSLSNFLNTAVMCGHPTCRKSKLQEGKRLSQEWNTS